MNQLQGLGNMVEYLLARHILNEPQANLSLSNPPHAIQQEEFSTAEFISAFHGKMFCQFCKNIGPACEANT